MKSVELSEIFLSQDFAPLAAIRAAATTLKTGPFKFITGASRLFAFFSFSRVLGGIKMGTKRSAEDADQTRVRPRRETTKRTKLSAIVDTNNSSDPSSCSVSVDSALQSSPPASEHTRESSLSSVHEPSHEYDSEESLSSSTSSDATESEAEEEVVTIGGPKKPTISSSTFSDETAKDLRTRLQTLLPQLAQGHDLLVNGGNIRSMENVEEDEQHIEMDLGLGVLEEKASDETSSASDDSSDIEDEEKYDEDLPVSSGATKRSQNGRDADVMGDLLGKKTGKRKVGIEDLG